MSKLENLIDTAGDEAKTLIKDQLLELLRGAKEDADSMANETGKKLESWLKMKLDGDIDGDELEALLNARKRAMRQYLNSQEIAARARLEKVTVELIDLVLNKALDAIV